MKKPIFIIFNDIHLKPGNEEEVLSAIVYMIGYAVKNEINDLIFAGDLFHSRSFQRQSSLDALDEILRLAFESGLTIYLFPGNHDKTEYNSFKSFLDIYRYHPCVKFNSELKTIVLGGVSVTLLPFFSDDLLIPMIEESNGSDILVSHFEMKGSTHLGKVSEKGSITKRMLRKFKKVYLGHYHNTHEISEDIIHLPSFIQDNFGEDSNKGFSVIFDDLSYEIIKGRFKEFHKVEINIDDISLTDLKKLIKLHANSSNTIRFEITGEESKLRSIDKSIFDGTGIDPKLKYDAVYELEDAVKPELIQKYEEDQIEELFSSFCIEKGYDLELGSKYLNKFLNNKKQQNG